MILNFDRNVMTSQDVVDFVQRRLDDGVTKLSIICEEVSLNKTTTIYF